MQPTKAVQRNKKVKSQYLSSNLLKDYKMYQDLIFDQNHSEQSSNIALIHQPSFDQSFKSSKQQISNARLYDDIDSKNLLKGDKHSKQQKSQFYGEPTYILFDSVIGDLQLEDEEIQLKRKNIMLLQQVSELHHQKKLLMGNLSYYKTYLKAATNIQQTAKKVYAKLNDKTKQLKQYTDSQQWQKQLKAKSGKRKQALALVKIQLQRNQKASDLRIEELKNKKLRLLQKAQQYKQSIRSMERQIEQSRKKRKQKLIDEKIVKQNKEIGDLEQSIKKMESILRKK